MLRLFVRPPAASTVTPKQPTAAARSAVVTPTLAVRGLHGSKGVSVSSAPVANLDRPAPQISEHEGEKDPVPSLRQDWSMHPVFGGDKSRMPVDQVTDDYNCKANSPSHN